MTDFKGGRGSPVRFHHATSQRPGAIGILQLHGDTRDILRNLTGIEDWPLHRVRLVDFAHIDQGLACRITANVTQLMPHGGPRVIQRLTAKLIEFGAEIAHFDSIDPLEAYPEAEDAFEALTLAALSRAQSPLALDLLLEQPARWRALQDRGETVSDEDRARSARLNRLLDPPTVVLAGRPNVGKSTLSNVLLGRTMSIALDMPGTTRDYTAGRIDLGGLVVNWHDTPGLRQTRDEIEAKSIDIARRLIDRADFLIAMNDPASDWPDLPRPADLQITNKADLSPQTSAQPGALRISAVTGGNLTALVTQIRNALVPPEDMMNPMPWLFHRRLENAVKQKPQPRRSGSLGEE